MKTVFTTNEVLWAIRNAKDKNPGFCTNFFPGQHKLQGWIDRSELYYDLREGVAFFLKRDRDFWHLYFAASSEALIEKELGTLPAVRNERITVDLIGQDGQHSIIKTSFESADFRIYNSLFRMSRPAIPITCSLRVAPCVSLAEHIDATDIYDLIESSFDRFAEQLPLPSEIEIAIAAKQIYVVKCHGTLAGLLFFETQGMTSSLRYWLVATPYRSQGFGSALMQQWFSTHAAAKRFLLWVLSANTEAIRKYEHYGFARDGLIDVVLANPLIPP